MAMDTPPAIIEPQFDFDNMKAQCYEDKDQPIITRALVTKGNVTRCFSLLIDKRTGCTWMKTKESLTLYACPEKK